MHDFEAYLIMVGIRSHEFSYTAEMLYDSIETFREFFNRGVSPYYALELLKSE